MYLCDIHSHTKLSPDSDALLEDMVRAALDAGLQELCVTDHCDLLDMDGAPVDCFDWPAAREQFYAAKALAGEKLQLRLGLELGSAPYNPAAARDILAKGGEELDFVLGSLHNWIGQEGNQDLAFSNYRDHPELCQRAMESTLDHTWTLVTQCADCYDSLAHIVYPLRYIHRDGMEWSIDGYEEKVRAIFKEVAKTDHALEVNVYRGKDLGSWPPLLEWYRQCGGKLVTIGGDAHRPEHVGLGVREGLELLKAAGFDCVTTYERRRPVLHKL